MNWLKKHYDGAILCAAALLLAGLSGAAYLATLNFAERFADRDSAKPRDHTIAEPPIEAIAEALALLEEPGRWSSHPGSLLASRIYILKDGELFDPIDSGDTMLHPPVPNAWLIEHNLDYSQADILEIDVDGDGFSVLEEFLAGTNPNDPESVPPYWTKIRLREYKRIPFKVKFSGSPDGGETFAINFIDDVTQPTQFLGIGDQVTIAGIPHTLVKYEPKTVTIDEIQRDVSELTVEEKTTGRSILLVHDQVVDSPTSFAVFQNLLSGATFEVKKGDNFDIEQEPEIEYTLIEISDNHATIRDVKSGETHQIPK